MTIEAEARAEATYERVEHTAPTDDRAALAALIDAEFDEYLPVYSESGQCVDSNAADAILAEFRLVRRGEAESDEREAVAKYLRDIGATRETDDPCSCAACQSAKEWVNAPLSVVLDALAFGRRAPAEPAVTDEMVERAARAWSTGSLTPNNWDNMTSRMQGITKDRMRAALVAALSTERGKK